MAREAYLGDREMAAQPAQFGRRPMSPIPKGNQSLECPPEGHGPGFYPDIEGVTPDPNIGGYVESFRGMSKQSIQEGLRRNFRELLGRDPRDDQELIDEMWRQHPSDGVGTTIDMFLRDNPELKSPFGPEIQTPIPRRPAPEVPTSMHFTPDRELA